ncbi:MAG: hypothetical protein H9872_02850 [Candidatus Cellulosilyticum pullistercoris]|uniref:Uncharacterized protein n=1 Tax=Candidatus Cellulosilyticum pullistercoris TaxID=2838521 RepID=A0A9E2KB81_9FIRM|nr:hypothetical protein [Candidatus Cellulosilyticum pullistercoris]
MRDKREKVPNKIDERPASNIEVSYANKLGIHLPENATRSDAKALIARDLDNDEKASSSLLEYARRKGMLCSDYIGNKALHNQLFDNLSEKDKIKFFCFCVYKFYWNDQNEDMENHSKKELFEAFGEQFAKDGYFKVSMEEYLGEELVAFGKSKRIVNGIEKTIYGGSAHTRAHNEAYRYLKANES